VFPLSLIVGADRLLPITVRLPPARASVHAGKYVACAGIYSAKLARL